MAEGLEHVCVLGGGSFGSTMARIVGIAVGRAPSRFHQAVQWWMFEKEVVAEIRQDRTNRRYLPGAVFTANLHATSDLKEAVAGATVLVVAIPSQFLESTLGLIKGDIAPGVKVLSVVKSLHHQEPCTLSLPSAQILELLGDLPLCALCGPNIYSEMATSNDFAEATLGAEDEPTADLMKALVSTDFFAVRTVTDRAGVEAAGALKNIVALGVGFAEGSGYGANTRASVIRVGLDEMARFACAHLGAREPQTFYAEACGIGDLVLTCTAGRGHRLAARFVQENEHVHAAETCEERWAALEEEMFDGMKLPDWHSAKAMRAYLRASNAEAAFPLFAIIGRISYDRKPASHIVEVVHSIVAGAGRDGPSTLPAESRKRQRE